MKRCLALRRRLRTSSERENLFLLFRGLTDKLLNRSIRLTNAALEKTEKAIKHALACPEIEKLRAEFPEKQGEPSQKNPLDRASLV